MAEGGPFPQPVDFAQWIDSIKPELKPPVANKLLFGGQQKVMVVGGPNTREDYHVEEGEEIFYQLQGDMVLETMECGVRRSVSIPEGHVFCLPGRIPHSPQRFANTVGLVIERDRNSQEIDGLRWYTKDGSGTVLYEEWFHCTDLGVQLKPVIERYFAMECRATGVPDQTFPPPPFELDTTTRLCPPVPLHSWVAAHTGAGRPEVVMCGPGAVEPSLSGFEFRLSFHTGPAVPAPSPEALPAELFLYQLKGTAGVAIHDSQSGTSQEIPLPPGSVLLVPGGARYAVAVAWPDGGLGMRVGLKLND